MSEPTLNSISSKIKENKSNELKSYIGQVFEEIVVNKPTAVLPELVFVEYFLDFFRSAGHMVSDSPLTLKWLELAGGPYNEVAIVDANGQVLFTTPGMFSRPDMNDKAMSDVSLLDITTNFNLRANRIYEDGINYLDGKLNGLDANVTSNYQEYVIRWKNIFNKYNKATNTDVNTKVKSTIVDNVNDFLDYD